MKTILQKYSTILEKDSLYSWSIVIFRVVIGFAMCLHGWKKIQNPLAWMGPDSPVPGLFQALAALSEFGGGIAWMLGLLTPLACLGIFSTMVVAASTHIQRGDAFVGKAPTYELAVIYALVAIVLFFNGPGKISVDYKIFSRRKK